MGGQRAADDEGEDGHEVVAEELDPVGRKLGGDRLEDYALLLRLAATFELDLAPLEAPVCEYRLRDDGSNTVLVEGAPATPEAVLAWKEAHRRIARRKE